MLCLDVNILVNGLRFDAQYHDDVAPWLVDAVNGDQQVGIPDVVASSFLRITTNRRVFSDAARPDEAWSDLDALLRAPAVRLIRPGERHFEHFRRTALEIGARANDVPDAYIAAYALEHNATLVSDDRGFAGVPGLRWQSVSLAN